MTNIGNPRAAMDRRTDVGPDRGWSWVIAFAACYTSLILAGIFRTSGILFVAFINEYGVTREEASWPVVLCTSVLNLTGIVTGALGQRFGVRPVVIVGSIVATTGISSCYLTTSFGTITFLFGIIFGIGYGLVTTLMPVIVNEYFLDYRATANGIANSGSCIGSVILPLFFEYLIDEYELSGCFLLTGGIVLHVAISGALMRPAPWLQKSKRGNIEVNNIKSGDNNRSENRRTYSCTTNEYDAVIRSIERRNSRLKCDDDCKTAVDKGGRPSVKEIKGGELMTKICGTVDEEKQCLDAKIYRSIEDLEDSLDKFEKVYNDTLKLSREYRSFHNSSETDNEQADMPNVEPPKLMNIKQNSLAWILDKQQCSKQNEQNQDVDSKTLDVNYLASSYRTNTIPNATSNENACCDEVKHLNRLPERPNSSKLPPSILKSFRIVSTCPMFYVIAGTNVSFYFLYFMYVLIIIDFSLDRGVPDKDTKYVLFAFAISDLVGRLGFGWITDRKLLRRQHYIMGCMILIGLNFFSFPFVYSFAWLVAASSVYGLLLGCTMVVFPILLVDFLGLEIQAVSMGCLCFLNGLFSLLRPFLIGYFRDSLGSYSNIFYVLGGISLTASFMWLLENCFVRTVKKKPECDLCKNVQ